LRDHGRPRSGQPHGPAGVAKLNTWDDLDQLDPITLVLLPSLEVRLARSRIDPGRQRPNVMSEALIRDTHRYAWSSWSEHSRAAVLDTSDMSPQEVARDLERAVSKPSGPQ